MRQCSILFTMLQRTCSIAHHSNRAKQRKCPIMDWKAKEEQSDERVGGVGKRYIYTDSAVCWAAMFWYLSKLQQKSWFPWSVKWLKERCGEPADWNSQKHWHNERCQQTENTENCISDRLQCFSSVYTTYGDEKQLGERRNHSCTQTKSAAGESLSN